MDSSTYEARLGLALEDLRKQAIPNFLATSKRFQVNRITLVRLFKGTQRNRHVAHSETQQSLSIA
jgi:hypothetical protein